MILRAPDLSQFVSICPQKEPNVPICPQKEPKRTIWNIDENPKYYFCDAIREFGRNSEKRRVV